MAEFISVMECISKRSTGTDDVTMSTSSSVSEETGPIEVNEQELEEQVNDLLEIKKKDILRKNITNIVRENIELKNKVKYLEEQLKAAKEKSSLGPGLSFRIGRS
jgi:ATP-dependent Lon protease